MELGILHNSPPSTKRGCRAGRLHRLWHGLSPAPWPCTRSQHHSVPSRNLHPLMVPPFLQPHPDLQSAVGNAPLSSKHPAQLPTTDCLLSIISPMGGQPSDAPALSPPSPLQHGGQSSNAPALSPPSPLPQGGQPIALALSPPSPPPQVGQPSDAPGLSHSSSTLLLCPSDSTLNICHLNSQSAVKTGMGAVSKSLLSLGAVVVVVAVLCNLPVNPFVPAPRPAPLSYLADTWLTTLHPHNPRRFKALELWEKTGAVIMAVRRPGCSLCREEALELAGIRAELRLRGVPLYAVVHQTLGVHDFAPFLNADDIYLDKERRFYGPQERWMLLSGFMRASVWINILRNKQKGVDGNLEGEGRLLGGE
ncbi:hypothetical protein ACOMHN_010886 [Nucella lapillus]